MTATVQSQLSNIERMIQNVIKTAIQETSRELVERVSTPILNGFGKSPVWTGQFIDNWRVGINSEDTSTNAQGQYYQFSAARRGDGFPISPRPSSAIGANIAELSSVKVGDIVYISNNTSYYDTETGEVTFTAQDVNRGTRTAPKGVLNPSVEASLARINIRVQTAVKNASGRGML